MASFTLRALAAGALLLAQPATASNSLNTWNSEQPACPSYFTPFVYQGCYADPVQKGLIFRSTVSSDDMTVEKCNAICKGNDFKYSGLEYYGICYCGNVLHASDPDDEAKCNTPCAGNHDQKCGGDDFFSVYEDPTFPDAPFSVKDYEDQGCWTGHVDGVRTLDFLVITGDSMTPEKCLASCHEDGMPYAGLEFGRECWCGTALPSNTQSVSIGECSKVCSGDSSLLCGGSDRLSLFKAKWGSSKPCGSETNVSTTTASTTTSSKPEYSTPSTTTTWESEEQESTTWGPEPPKSSKPEPPKTTKPEPPKTTKPEPPKTTKPEPPKTTKPEPPKTTKPEPPKTTKTESTLVTTTKGSTTSDEPLVCTSVVPSHNYCCGGWCSQNLPDFDDHNSCKKARAFCHLQTAACFKYAGWPTAWECHKYKQWCNTVNSYCTSDCSSKKGSCSRHHCLGRNPPKGGPPPVTKTIPCATGTTYTATATTAPPVVPSPEGLCIQPTDEEQDYGPGNPVGGIDLPIVTCNNDREDHGKGKHFKCYSERHFDQCHSFERKELYRACSLACVEQYDQCIEGYAEGSNDKPKKRSLGDKDKDKNGKDDKKDDDDKKDRKGDDDEKKPGHGKDRDGKDRDEDDKKGGKKDDKDDKEKKLRKRRCKIQYGDCVSENRRADPSSFCLKYDQQ
ncbi:WSC domain-containing protein [Plectosphaerella plurivora]|uniref:WSC domain-containing protein n=1 Tax=Plectosphaerella plurivora TaxID=936078 RepID=A0A9P8VJ21_9PEZI|nr:WSC domain-containing protein [Plectosphaerella plurivora]